MKRISVGIIIGLVLGAGTTWFALQPGSAAGKAAAEAPANADKPKENPLHVVAAKRESLGLTLQKPSTAMIAPEVESYGRVIDPAPFISLAAEWDIARAALAASEKSAVRARELFAAGGNASRQALETAEAAEVRDRATAAAARGRLVAGLGRDASDPERLRTLLAAIERGQALARLDVLVGEAIAEQPGTAQVSPALGGPTLAATILGHAPSADPQVQGRSFLALLGDSALPVGTALRATFPGAGEPASALVVPRNAIVYHQGSAWVYVLGEEDTFERKIVTLGRWVGDKVALTGIDDDDQVLTTGAGQLLSAELQAGGAPEEK